MYVSFVNIINAECLYYIQPVMPTVMMYRVAWKSATGATGYGEWNTDKSLIKALVAKNAKLTGFDSRHRARVAAAEAHCV